MRVAAVAVDVSNRGPRGTPTIARFTSESPAIIWVITARESTSICINRIPTHLIHINALLSRTWRASVVAIRIAGLGLSATLSSLYRSRIPSRALLHSIAQYQLDLRRELREVAARTSLRERLALMEIRKARPLAEEVAFFRHRWQVHALGVEHVHAAAALHESSFITVLSAGHAAQSVGLQDLRCCCGLVIQILCFHTQIWLFRCVLRQVHRRVRSAAVVTAGDTPSAARGVTQSAPLLRRGGRSSVTAAHRHLSSLSATLLLLSSLYALRQASSSEGEEPRP